MTTSERAADIDTIVATMVERIAHRFDPERILLCGSRARGDAKDWSDVDLLVVMPDGTERREAAVEMGVAVGDLPIAKDISSRRLPIPRSGAMSSARCCGRRCAKASSSMSEPEAAPEAGRWLRSAREDLLMVRMALGETPPVVGPACFHSQPAAEKALKAALVLESIEFPYVHDLRRLRNLLPNSWPVGPSNIALQRLTE